ncbi:MAG TPA: hypothetical protein DC047_18610 [Blastocatellia bacterium]|nr:hypothetical protein [Blastocatellia bacterium]
MVRRLRIQLDSDQSAPQRQSILFRPAGKLFLSLSEAGSKTPFNPIYSATLRRFVIQCSACLAPLLEARADHPTIFQSAYRPERLPGRRTVRGAFTSSALPRFQVGSALQEITSTKWQKN